MKLLNPRGFGLVCATVAVGSGLVVAGCSNAVHGTPTVNQADAAAYRTEMASSSAAATSSRKAAAQTKAIAEGCKSFRDVAATPITGNAVTRYNDFVDAHDSNAPDQDAKRDLAAQTLEDAARQVENGINSGGAALPPDIAQKFTDYVNAARALAAETRKMVYTAPVGPLNDASQRVNDALGIARNLCPTK
ncbi:hypothetical protein [Nocardia terpenica]|uniref:DUF732 domain-containing protein n=1 Tax=Nocardia terpenica TaxID=455432 RepID=A0A6G9Z1L4_9NOCA|nr:hypothetical protein [Nocardia terpenica]QIS18893.1 hypothetical protein F6W96_11905 [Nocardia terpenica]